MGIPEGLNKGLTIRLNKLGVSYRNKKSAIRQIEKLTAEQINQTDKNALLKSFLEDPWWKLTPQQKSLALLGNTKSKIDQLIEKDPKFESSRAKWIKHWNQHHYPTISSGARHAGMYVWEKTAGSLGRMAVRAGLRRGYVYNNNTGTTKHEKLMKLKALCKAEKKKLEEGDLLPPRLWKIYENRIHENYKRAKAKIENQNLARKTASLARQARIARIMTSIKKTMNRIEKYKWVGKSILVVAWLYKLCDLMLACADYAKIQKTVSTENNPLVYTAVSAAIIATWELLKRAVAKYVFRGRNATTRMSDYIVDARLEVDKTIRLVDKKIKRTSNVNATLLREKLVNLRTTLDQSRQIFSKTDEIVEV